MSVSMFYFWNFFPNEIEIRKKKTTIWQCCVVNKDNLAQYDLNARCYAQLLYVHCMCGLYAQLTQFSRHDQHVIDQPAGPLTDIRSLIGQLNGSITRLRLVYFAQTPLKLIYLVEITGVLFNIRYCSFLVFCMNIMIYIWAFDINYGQQNGLIKMKMICSVGSTHIWENHIFITFKNIFMFFR